MEDSVLLIVWISHEPGKLARVTMNHSEIQRAEVLVEGEVSKIIINIEEECVLVVLWWFRVRKPIQFIYK